MDSDVISGLSLRSSGHVYPSRRLLSTLCFNQLPLRQDYHQSIQSILLYKIIIVLALDHSLRPSATCRHLSVYQALKANPLSSWLVSLPTPSVKNQ